MSNDTYTQFIIVTIIATCLSNYSVFIKCTYENKLKGSDIEYEKKKKKRFFLCVCVYFDRGRK